MRYDLRHEVFYEKILISNFICIGSDVFCTGGFGLFPDSEA